MYVKTGLQWWQKMYLSMNWVQCHKKHKRNAKFCAPFFCCWKKSFSCVNREQKFTLKIKIESYLRIFQLFSTLLFRIRRYSENSLTPHARKEEQGTPWTEYTHTAEMRDGRIIMEIIECTHKWFHFLQIFKLWNFTNKQRNDEVTFDFNNFRFNFLYCNTCEKNKGRWLMLNFVIYMCSRHPFIKLIFIFNHLISSPFLQKSSPPK